MKCKYSRIDLINYVEGTLSEKTRNDINNHLNNCDTCKAFCEAQLLINKFGENDVAPDKDFSATIIDVIDRKRYKRKNILYSLGSSITNLKAYLKPSIGVLLAIICIVFFVTYYNQINKFINNSGEHIIDFTQQGVERQETKDETAKPTIEPTKEPTIEPTKKSTKEYQVERQETKVETIMIEGIKEEKKFKLVTSETMKFSTYIPNDYIANEEVVGGAKWLNIYANYNGEINENIAVRFFSTKNNHITDYKTDSEKIIEESINLMIEQGFTITEKDNRLLGIWSASMSNNSTNVSGYLTAFKYNNKIICLAYYYPPEFGDGAYPRIQKILDEFMWFDGIVLSKHEILKFSKLFVKPYEGDDKKINFSETVVINDCFAKDGPGEEYKNVLELKFGDIMYITGRYGEWTAFTKGGNSLWVKSSELINEKYHKEYNLRVITADRVTVGRLILEKGSLVQLLIKDKDRSCVTIRICSLSGGKTGWIDNADYTMPGPDVYYKEAYLKDGYQMYKEPSFEAELVGRNPNFGPESLVGVSLYEERDGWIKTGSIGGIAGWVRKEDVFIPTPAIDCYEAESLD